ncbi:hypothetical protein ACFOEE_11185 [Pseudoalteromonas fenneropenaei]|uniref:Uncharacterized protein n=1 Tax=Pseudoalteromonas fenneropenaei TaxID=1737459 RepID=A0ABV7CKV5_9GAMM
MEKMISITRVLSSWWKRHLPSFVSYYHEHPYKFDKGELVQSDKVGVICIVSKKFCKVSRKHYHSVSPSEIRSIVKIQKKNIGNLVHVKICPLQVDDEFEVITTEFLIDEAYSNRFCIYLAEDALFSRVLKAKLLSLHTPAGQLFIARSVSKSAYKGGLIQSLEQFSHSVGVAFIDAIEVQPSKFPEFLLSAIFKLNIKDIAKEGFIKTRISTSPIQNHSLIIAPIVAFTLGVGVYCLSLFWQLESVKATLMNSTSIANKIIQHKAELDTKTDMVNDVSKLLMEQRLTYPHWQLIELALSRGTMMNYFRFENDVFKLDGVVEDANALLEEFNNHPLVSSAVFDGAVRKNNNLDNFVIQVSFKN